MRQIIEHINTDKRKIIGLAQDLINIPTINPPGLNYRRFAGFLQRKCNEFGLKTKLYSVSGKELKMLGIDSGDERVNLVARWDTGAKRTLHINCHYDVVPATKNWKTDPFKATIKNGKLYGRGSEDMKANIASLLYAIRALKKTGISPAVNIELSFTCDEETGGRSGLGYLLRKGLVKADYALGEGYEDNYVSIGNKGMLWLEVEGKGKSAHSSTPYLGKNSFEYMTAVAAELLELKDILKRRKTKYGVRFKNDAYSTMVMGGLLKGGRKVNIVPDSSVFSIDRRLIPEESLPQAKKEIKETIKKACAKNKKIKAGLKVITQQKAVVTKIDKNMFRAFSRAIETVLKKKMKTALMAGGTDMRFFMQRGIPALGYSVHGGNRAHADNEFVFIKSLVDTAKIFALFICNLDCPENCNKKQKL